MVFHSLRVASLGGHGFSLTGVGSLPSLGFSLKLYGSIPTSFLIFQSTRSENLVSHSRTLARSQPMVSHSRMMARSPILVSYSSLLASLPVPSFSLSSAGFILISFLEFKSISSRLMVSHSILLARSNFSVSHSPSLALLSPPF
jgi:hypothetical protein